MLSTTAPVPASTGLLRDALAYGATASTSTAVVISRDGRSAVTLFDESTGHLLATVLVEPDGSTRLADLGDALRLARGA